MAEQITPDDIEILRILIACADRDGCLDEADRGHEIVRKMERLADNHAAWRHAADQRWRQLDAVRERVSAQLLSIDTLARNVAEYPDRIPLLIETVESLYARVQDGSIAKLDY
jgi:uncharacterized membrane protein YebE (DUF533 family)